jgi:uncharacterized cupin superfamily protein
MPKINTGALPTVRGSSYPPPFDEPCKGRTAIRLAAGAGLAQFGVNFVTLEPGAWSSQRHWHEKEDELVYVLSGELTLVEDEGETILGPGDCAAWKAGVRNGHHLINRSSASASFIVVGSRDDNDWGEYSDIDMRFNSARYTSGGPYSRKDGTPY